MFLVLICILCTLQDVHAVCVVTAAVCSPQIHTCSFTPLASGTTRRPSTTIVNNPRGNTDLYIKCKCAELTVGSWSSCCQDVCPENSTVQAEIVSVHNTLRREVEPSAADMLMMSYSEDLGARAQAWVSKCILKHGPPEARMIDGYEVGENLFFSTSPTAWSNVITAWFDERSHYVYPNGSIDGRRIYHYTQMVWNSSYKVGCGLNLCNGTYFYDCRYYRAGNFKRWPPYKAGAPCAACPNNCVDKLCTNPCPYINKFTNCPHLKNITGCSNWLVSAWCPASCKCNTEIIPVY